MLGSESDYDGGETVESGEDPMAVSSGEWVGGWVGRWVGQCVGGWISARVAVAAVLRLAADFHHSPAPLLPGRIPQPAAAPTRRIGWAAP